MNSISNDDVRFVFDIAYLLIISSSVYLLHVVVQGLFLKKIKQKRITKYITAIFPSVVFFYISSEDKEVIPDDVIYFYIVMILLVQTGLHWYWIFSNSIIYKKFTSYEIQTTFFLLFIFPFLGILIMAIWLFVSRNRQELYFIGDSSPAGGDER